MLFCSIFCSLPYFAFKRGSFGIKTVVIQTFRFCSPGSCVPLTQTAPVALDLFSCLFFSHKYTHSNTSLSKEVFFIVCLFCRLLSVLTTHTTGPPWAAPNHTSVNSTVAMFLSMNHHSHSFPLMTVQIYQAAQTVNLVSVFPPKAPGFC